MKLAFLFLYVMASSILGFEIRELSNYVAPRIGAYPDTVAHGKSAVGPQMPFGSVNPGPDGVAKRSSGYQLGDSIRGFSQLHVTGTGGWGKYGNFLLSPQIGLAAGKDSHVSAASGETIECGYYACTLTRYDIRTEIAATHNCAIYRFKFPSSTDAHILLDLGHNIPQDLMRIPEPNEAWATSGAVSLDTATATMTGTGSWVGGWHPGEYTLYFAAEFSKAPRSWGTWINDAIDSGAVSDSTNQAKDRIGAYFGFDTETDEEILVKIAVSFVSVDKAKDFLEDEIPAFDFDSVKTACKARWDKELSSILVNDASATDSQLTVFYTALYHTMCMPHDRTGDSPWGGNLPFFDDHYCGWDTYRTQFPLLGFLKPSVAAKIVNSYINRYEQRGYVSDAFIAGIEAWAQGGDCVDNDLADAYLKKLPGVDWDKALEIGLAHANNKRAPSYRKNDRGWVTRGETDLPMTGASKSIEYNYNDFCVAIIAAGQGDSTNADRFLERSKQWEHLWDSSVTSNGFQGFLQPKNNDGSFVSVDPTERGNWFGLFYEGTPWEYSFHIPHDFARLIELCGGQETFVDKLAYGIDHQHSNIGNQPGFILPRAFTYAGRPDLTCKYTRRSLAMFTDNGYPGDEDSGSMSAYYVWSCLGLFPNAGQNVYLLSAPIFSEVAIQLENDCTITIKAHNPSWENKYVSSTALNGLELNKAWLTNSDLLGGAELVFSLTADSTALWARDATAPPSLNDSIYQLPGSMIVAVEDRGPKRLSLHTKRPFSALLYNARGQLISVVPTNRAIGKNIPAAGVYLVKPQGVDGEAPAHLLLKQQ